MTTEQTDPRPNGPAAEPLALRLNAQLGLVERLRTDVLWHRRRGNETIARDCQEAADELERAWAARDAAVADLEAHAESEVRRAVAATRRLLRSALLEEAAQWTGDFRMPVHKGLCDAAKRAGVPLTLDECYQAAKRA